jgi:hypothetical protein
MKVAILLQSIKYGFPIDEKIRAPQIAKLNTLYERNDPPFSGFQIEDSREAGLELRGNSPTSLFGLFKKGAASIGSESLKREKTETT